MKRQYNIKNDEGVLLGTVEVDVGSAALDFALTPIVEIDKDSRPEVTGFLASPRTDLDIRPRQEKWPYVHLGHKAEVFGTMIDLEEADEMDDLDNLQGLKS